MSYPPDMPALPAGSGQGGHGYAGRVIPSLNVYLTPSGHCPTRSTIISHYMTIGQPI